MCIIYSKIWNTLEYIQKKNIWKEIYYKGWTYMIMTVKSPHLQDESSKLETQESQRERGLKNRGQEPGESMVEFQTDKQAEDLERGNISVWV